MALDRHVKSIDNALQRIKRKVEQHLEYREMLARGDRRPGRTGLARRQLAGVAQLVEQRTCNAQVGGSSPLAGSIHKQLL